jgi:AraC-like DNA-binding protein
MSAFSARRNSTSIRAMIVASHSKSSVRRLSRARDLLRESLDQKLTIERAAREAGLSRSEFIRSFKAVFGQTPHQARIDARLDLAKRLLITDAMSVTDICLAAGFASLGTFSHVFSCRVGLSPTVFRRDARALIQVPGSLPPRLYPGCFMLMRFLPV